MTLVRIQGSPDHWIMTFCEKRVNQGLRLSLIFSHDKKIKIPSVGQQYTIQTQDNTARQYVSRTVQRLVLSVLFVLLYCPTGGIFSSYANKIDRQ